jgi:hypothetical protein
MTSEPDPDGLRARLIELLDPQGVPERARRMAQRGGRSLRGKPVRGVRRARSAPPPAAATGAGAGGPAPGATVPVATGDRPMTATAGADQAPRAPATARADRASPSVGARGAPE